MSARLAYVVNPMSPAIGARVAESEAGLSVSSALALTGWKLAATTVLVRGGVPVKRCDWDAVPINDNEEVFFVVIPLNRDASQVAGVIASLALAVFAPGIGTFLAGTLGLAGTTVLGISTASLLTTAVLVGGQTLISTLLAPPKPFSGNTTPSPTYSLSGTNNRARLGEAIPDAGGRNMILCDLFTAPYVEYVDNKQVVSLGLMVGVGDYEIEAVRFGEDIVANYGSVNANYPIELEQCGPTAPVTLIDDNVETSSEVNGITMLGTNEEGYTSIGPFICSRPGTKPLALGFDVFFPGGLGAVDANGQLTDATVTFTIEIQTVSNAGVPSGSWSTLLTQSITRSTRQPQRISYRQTNFTPGRFQARLTRTNARAVNKNTVDTIQWGGMRAYHPSVSDYAGLTKIALRVTAGANVNNDQISKVNLICTRKLPYYASGSWHVAATTRNPAWYAAYLMRDAALGNLPDSRLPLDQLVSLATTWNSRGDWFDGVFDQRKSLWENLQSVLFVGRARPFLAGSAVAIVRDEAKTVPVAAFNPRNMLPASFSVDYTFNQVNAVDALMAQFIDNRTWTPNQVLCALPDFAGDPEDAPPFQVFGITDRDHVWREIITLVAQNRYRRRAPSFKTAREGLVCFLGSYIKVGHWLPTWSKAASVLTLTQDAGGDILLLSEPWAVPAGKSGEAKLVTITAPDGRAYGPVTFALLDDGADTSRAQIRLTSTYAMTVGLYAGDHPRDWPIWSGSGLEFERPRCMIGTASEQPQGALLVSMKPDAGGKTTSVVCVLDDSRVHAADADGPPAEVGGPASTLGADLTITAIALTESIIGSNVNLHLVVTGAADATSFDMHIKAVTDVQFEAPYRGLARTSDTQIFGSSQQLLLEMRAKGAAGYGPWFRISFYFNGITDTTPGNVGTITTNGVSSNNFVTGTSNGYDWADVSTAGSYLIRVWAKATSGGTYAIVREREVLGSAYTYYANNEIDDGGPWYRAYIEVKAKNAAGVSAAWTASHF